MLKRRVWRYKCEFCKKANCSSFHIAKHEKGCTNNPNRVCGMCAFMDKHHLTNGHKAMPLADVVAGLVPVEFDSWHDQAKIDAWLQTLRSKMNGCPACMLAVIRQAPDGAVPPLNFDYKTAIKAFWEAYNEERPNY